MSASATVLLIVLGLHLWHHRLAREAVSYVEVLAVASLLLPSDDLASALSSSLHLVLGAVMLVGSLDIRRLAPKPTGAPRPLMGTPR